MRRRALVGGAVIALTLVPSVASADAGTPLIWGTMFQLTVGNALIGVFEAWLLARWFGGARGPGAVGRVVLGNYVSCGAGLAVLYWSQTNAWLHRLAGADGSILVHARALAIELAVLTWALSIVLEAPFVWSILPKARRRIRHVLLASTAAQTASYVILAACCVGVSNFSMYRYATVRADTSFAPRDWRVYFENPDDDHFWSVRLDGAGRREESERSLPARTVLTLGTDGSPARVWAILADGSALASTSVPIDGFDWRPPVESIGRDPMFLVDLRLPRPRTLRNLEYWPDPWAGFRYRGDEYGIESVGGTLSPLRMVFLPRDVAVFSTVYDEIDVFDPNTKTIGFLTRGRSPVVLPETR